MEREAVMACITVRRGAGKQEFLYRLDEDNVRHRCSVAN